MSLFPVTYKYVNQLHPILRPLVGKTRGLTRAIVVVDLDNTVFCNMHRSHLAPTGDDVKKNEKWKAFNKACIDDRILFNNVDMINRIAKSLTLSYEDKEVAPFVVFVTGRSAHAKIETLDAMTERLLPHVTAGSIPLIMRAESDHRLDVEYKRQVFKELGLREGDLIFDDLSHIIDMARDEFNVFAIQVPNSYTKAGMGKKH